MTPPRTRPTRCTQPPRTYLETNCYADVLIELLHARGDEPLAMFGFIVATDWEGDQFTYAKPPYADLTRLFGIEVHEMLPYRSLPEHIEEQLRHGRTVLVEMDAWYLPDTAATSYRREHLKTTIVPEAIDRGAERMRYFHNTGLLRARAARTTAGASGCSPTSPTTSWTRSPSWCASTSDPA